MFLFKRLLLTKVLVFFVTLGFYSCYNTSVTNRTVDNPGIEELKAGFANPPDSTRPGVYWYFMEGSISKEGMTKDLESMKKVGIGNVLFIEVNVGVPRGPVNFLSDEWMALFKHAVDECRRLGIVMMLGIGPAWTGSGGPWVTGSQSMQHLVSSTVQLSGSETGPIKLPLPAPKKPYFGEGPFTPELKKQWQDFYEDVAVLAFPSTDGTKKISDADEKALYYRAPYTSAPAVKPYLSSSVDYDNIPAGASIPKKQIIDLTGKLQPDGTLNWKAPEGKWTIMRFGRRNNGATTRPAPVQGLGFESDKFDTVALNKQLQEYLGKIINKLGTKKNNVPGGFKTLFMDSWESGSQNWTPNFRQEFTKRRGYDPLPFYPVYAGNIVESPEISERFLWDLRQTSQELILEFHALHIKKYGRQYGLNLAIEPYDMNPTADLELGAIADIPAAEFWSKNFGFNSAFSCIEATSIAHVEGKSVVLAEAFTGESTEGWKQYPGSMKDQGDWAFAMGLNKFYYHTFAHKPFNDSLQPGMTMGPYGVHWDRKQTWWPMALDYHRYISRCQFILQKGKAVADILYLTPEGSPHVFLPPPSALIGNDTIPDKKGYNFDGCSPGQLYKASVKNHKVVFPGGASYELLVLPAVKTMTPALLEKIRALINDGASVIGIPPVKSPGLSDFPECDQKIQSLAKEIWGSMEPPTSQGEHAYGKGRVIWGGELTTVAKNTLYPEYSLTAALLKKAGISEDFETSGQVRYTHRTSNDMDIYFVANRTNQLITTSCSFRTTKGTPELWDPLTGKTRILTEFNSSNGRTSIPLQFEPYQSFFIVFANGKSAQSPVKKNFPAKQEVAALNAPWKVSFDPKWGGPENTTFDHLVDWTTRVEDGIRYYSGIAVYSQTFDITPTGNNSNKKLYLDLGEVKNMARVRLNGQDLGVVWTAPWKVDITSAVKQKNNQLEIEVANLWPNRLIGDERLPNDGIKNGKWPDWLLKGEKRTSGRYTFTTYNPYKKESPLLKSGLIGPVTIQQTEF